MVWSMVTRVSSIPWTSSKVGSPVRNFAWCRRLALWYSHSWRESFLEPKYF